VAETVNKLKLGTMLVFTGHSKLDLGTGVAWKWYFLVGKYYRDLYQGSDDGSKHAPFEGVSLGIYR